METPEPGPADGEERLVELRPRTRSNPEGAEDRRNSTGSLGGNTNPNISQSAVGNRVEGEGEASTSDSPPSSTTTTTVSTAAPQSAAATAGVPAAACSVVPLSTAAGAAKDRPKPTQQQPTLPTPVPPQTEYQLRVPRVNCPEKVVGGPSNFQISFRVSHLVWLPLLLWCWQIICLDLSEEMSLPKLESFNGWARQKKIRWWMFRLFLLTCCACRSKTNALNVCQKMIEMFVRTKHKIDKRHEFALVVVNDDALWVSGAASSPSRALSPRLKPVCTCLSYQASPLTPGSCAAACMTSTPMCVNLLVSFESLKNERTRCM